MPVVDDDSDDLVMVEAMQQILKNRVPHERRITGMKWRKTGDFFPVASDFIHSAREHDLVWFVCEDGSQAQVRMGPSQLTGLAEYGDTNFYQSCFSGPPDEDLSLVTQRGDIREDNSISPPRYFLYVSPDQ